MTNTTNDATETTVAETTVAETTVASIILPDELTVDFRTEIGTKTVKLSDKSLEWILWAINNGLKQSIGDAIAGKAGTEEGKKLILAKFDRVCNQGLIPTGGSGGGSRLSIQDAAWITYFKSKGSPVKFKGETPNSKSLNKYQLAFTRKAIWPSVKAHLATLSEADQRDFHANKLTDLIASNKALVVKKAEEADLKPFIKAEQMKREGKKPEQPAFNVSITL